MADFGADIACLTDIGLRWGIARGKTCLGNRIVRRLSTPRGGLSEFAPGYAPDYGYDVRALLGEGATRQTIAAGEAAIARECEKDEAVRRARTSLTFDSSEETLTIEINLDTEDGPFRLVLEVTSVTIEILRAEG